ncbi:Phosphoglycerate mutase [hydrothermal vent metagenome]|uniref:Phosphoglycerate mutase n=1 Tax=hydrothermal vent metagenome TaxID=652676 RepID=A0A1W1EIY7_9ZZZZ
MLYLLRHGETNYNVEGRYQGSSNSPLTLKGKQQAKENAFKLKNSINNFNNIIIYSSPQKRAKESAFILVDNLGISRDKIVFDKRLREISYGIFEAETKDYCQKNYPNIFKAREDDKWFYKIDGGESYQEATIRVREWLSTLDKSKIIIAITHEMINRVIRKEYQNLSISRALSLRQANWEIIELH